MAPLAAGWEQLLQGAGDWWLIRASWAESLNRLTAGEWVDQRTEETTQPHRGGKGKGEAEDSGAEGCGQVDGDNRGKCGRFTDIHVANDRVEILPKSFLKANFR